MKILVIVNPVSGGGRAGRLATRLSERLERFGHLVETFRTERVGDASRRAGAVDGETDRIAVVGGDGTLNEVLNGLSDPSRTPLGQLPTGTANILGHELRLPANPDRLAEMLSAGRVRRVDMGLVGARRFLMVCSAGFDAMVTKEIKRHRTGTLGYKGYFMPILRVLRNYKPARMEISVDGRAARGELVIVSNTRNYGGLFTIADRARCDSGHLDVCVLGRASLISLLRAGAAGLIGGLSGHPGVTYLTGREIALESRESVPVEIDGDYAGSTPVQIGVVPSHVPVVVPDSGAG